MRRSFALKNYSRFAIEFNIGTNDFDWTRAKIRKRVYHNQISGSMICVGELCPLLLRCASECMYLCLCSDELIRRFIFVLKSEIHIRM